MVKGERSDKKNIYGEKFEHSENGEKLDITPIKSDREHRHDTDTTTAAFQQTQHSNTRAKCCTSHSRIDMNLTAYYYSEAHVGNHCHFFFLVPSFVHDIGSLMTSHFGKNRNTEVLRNTFRTVTSVSPAKKILITTWIKSHCRIKIPNQGPSSVMIIPLYFQAYISRNLVTCGEMPRT